MNTYMISSGYGGCSYVRILLPAWHNGFNTDISSPLSLRDDTETIKKSLANADVVVFHRPEIQEYHDLAKILKKDGKKVVMDNDDTFKIDYHPLAQFTPDAIEVNLKKRGKSIDDFMKIADLVTTTTETLAKEYRNISDNVVVLPNYIDPLDWDEPLRNNGEVIRIGMVGSVAFEYDYLHMKDVIRKLDKRADVQFVMFGLGDAKHRKDNPNVTKAFKDDYDFWDSIDIEHLPWCPIEEYPTKLNEMELDIMLIPRKENYFNRCKSNVKVLEAGMCEIPVIAQSFKDGPYEEFTHNENIILVKDNDKWLEEIERLMDDKKLRRKIGKNIHKYVLDEYNIENNAYKWQKAYDKLYEN